MTSKLPNAARLEAVRARVSQTQAEIEALPAQPLPVADAIARLDAWIAAKSELFDHGTAARAFATDRALLGGVLAAQGVKTAESAVTTDLAPVLCALFGTEIRERLSAAIQAQTRAAGPSLAERPATLAALRAELERLEREEERIIRDSESAGEPLARRPDASPAVVLAP